MKLSSTLSTVALLVASVTAFPTPSSKSINKRDVPGDTLEEGYYWIRAVQDPYFHFYLQTDPLYSATTALMGDHTTAGQFQITDGQLEALIDTDGSVLYLNPGEGNGTSTQLPVTFKKTKSALGAFEWQGMYRTFPTHRFLIACLYHPQSANPIFIQATRSLGLTLALKEATQLLS